MRVRVIIAVALSWMVWGCETSTQHGKQSQTGRGAAPEIVDYYAA
jgi:hypothetical protein